MKRILLAALVALALLGSGCGTTTMAVLSSQRAPYSGVVLDIYALATPAAPIVLVDLPLSFVADTTMLPFTLAPAK